MEEQRTSGLAGRPGKCAASPLSVKERLPFRGGVPIVMPTRGTQTRSDTMTQTSNRMFDELAKLLTDAASVAQGVRREAETVVRVQVERWIADMDLVKREDFDVVREMASKARAENERLALRVAELEARLGIKSEAVEPAGGSAAPAKPEGPINPGTSETSS